jgi:peptide/nickel transport system permease protein
MFLSFKVKNKLWGHMLFRGSRKVTLNFKIGSIILFILLFIGIFGSYIAPYDAEEMHYKNIKERPSRSFLLGTDRFGRDVLSRIIIGTKPTLIIAISSTALALIMGIILGLFSAYSRKLIDNVLMRANDIVLSFPGLIFAMLVIGVLGPGIVNGIIAIALIFAPSIARVIRSVALNIVYLEYIDAARIRGESSLYIIFYEILPNLFPTIIVEGCIRLGYAILISASLSYIGLGPPPPTPDWGLMVSEERGYMLNNPWPVFGPCLAIVITVIGINLFGDGIRNLLVAKRSINK